MKWLTRKDEATPYENGTKIKSKGNGSIGVIEKLCNCGSGIWLHYEVRIEGRVTIFLHEAIERLFDRVD
ncbi:MAG: hypothetical protein HYZ44_17100 [Bacteroidetes bacterium]|nr:hypothetical protein [Bacteroidota bacterium]